MSYANRKFGHCIITWNIDGCCRQPYSLDFDMESSVFHIAAGNTFTRWRMSVRHKHRRNGISEMRFEIKRLLYDPDPKGFADGELWLTLCDGNGEREIACGSFELRIMSSWKYDFDIIDPLPSPTLTLKVHMVYHYRFVDESLPECTDPYIKQLSKDMRELFVSTDNGHDITFTAGHFFALFLHKDILLQRLKKEEAKTLVREQNLVELGATNLKDSWYKALCFLYTADMNISTQMPSVGAYKAAERFGIEPMLTYYEPDYLQLYTRTEYEGLDFTWNIADIHNRNARLVSRQIVGDAGNSIMTLTTEGYDKFISFVVNLHAEKYLCIELRLKTETSETLLDKYHGRVWADSSTRNTVEIPRNKLRNVPVGGGVTFKLMVRFSCIECEEDRKRLRAPIIGKSLNTRKPYFNQQNYIQLSNDLMSVYRSSKYFSIDISSPVAMYNNKKDDYILRFRNERLANVLFAEDGGYHGQFEPDVVRALLQFIYCAKLGDTVGITDSFRLIDISNECMFESLRNALIDNVKGLLTPENANEVYALAENRNMLEFMTYMRSRDDLPNVYQAAG